LRSAGREADAGLVEQEFAHRKSGRGRLLLWAGAILAVVIVIVLVIRLA
jgi:hypothetical protein